MWCLVDIHSPMPTNREIVSMTCTLVIQVAKEQPHHCIKSCHQHPTYSKFNTWDAMTISLVM